MLVGMASKRALLELLSRDELLAAVDLFDVDVPDRRAKDGLVDALVASRKVSLAQVLADFPRDRLKDLCRSLGLDDAGREKTALIDRLTGASAAAVAPGGSTNATTAAGNGASATAAGNGTGAAAAQPRTNGKRAAAAPPTGKLTREQLEGYLWSAADILRGSIDSSDYKNYILGLLFLKRLSDRFAEECETLVKDGDDPEDKDNHQFFVPKRARWSEIQKAASNIGEVLNKACAALEDGNPALDGVLAGIDYNDEQKLGDTKNRDNVLSRLVQHFSGCNLRNANLSEPDMLGRAYEYLIEKFADDAGKKGGEFYTPKKVVELIVEILAPKEGMRICDPTCGSGGMLIECARHLERHGQNPKNLSLFGQEKNLGTWAICQMNMLLHGITSHIFKGDTIRDPKLVDGGELRLYDRVIANPPFSLDDWGREVAEHDPWGRFRFGIPPKTKGDLAFVQHMIATLNLHGQLGVVMPHGVLFRGAAEGEIRQGILKEDLIEAVIGLPPNLFYGTGIPAAILVMNRDKKRERKGKVLFIEASREFGTAPTQNRLRDEDVKRIAAAFHAWNDVPKYARVVDLAEIEKNDFSLNISRYVETAEATEKVDVAAAIAKLREAEGKRAEADARLNAFLRELGFDG